MSAPGRRLIKWAARLCTERFRETVVVPAVADMQFEYAEAGTRRGRRLAARLRGYGALLNGFLCYGALVPGRHLRENWSHRGAPGPLLVIQAGPRILLYSSLFVTLLFFFVWGERPRLDFETVTLLLPGQVLALMPFTVALALGLALSGNSGGAAYLRAARDLGAVAAIMAFALWGYVVPAANQSYREAAYRNMTGHESRRMLKGDREMTFSELGAAIAAEGDSQPRASLRVQWHMRLSFPLLCVSLVALATLLVRSGARQGPMTLVLLGSFWGATQLLQMGETYGVRGELPAAVAAWGGHVVPGFLALLCVLYRTSWATRRVDVRGAS